MRAALIQDMNTAPGQAITVVTVVAGVESAESRQLLEQSVLDIAAASPSALVRWVTVYRGDTRRGDASDRVLRRRREFPNLHALDLLASGCESVAAARAKVEFCHLRGDVIHLDGETATQPATVVPLRSHTRLHTLRSDLRRLASLVGAR